MHIVDNDSLLKYLELLDLWIYPNNPNLFNCI